jgi:Tol biopolymer transport system component
MGLTCHPEIACDKIDWSLASQQIACTSGKAIISTRIPQGAVAMLLQTDGYLTGLSWSPDASQLVFTAGKFDTASDLYLLDVGP